MAIVLKYGSPGPLLQAGFAAGVGHRRNAQQEDLLKIWQQQQAQAFQAQQANADRQQRAAFQQQALNRQADQDAINLDARLQQRYLQSEQNKALNDFRVSQSEQKLNDSYFKAESDRQQRVAGDQQKFSQQLFLHLPPIPAHADPDQRKFLTDQKNAMRDLVSPKWNQSDPKTQEAFQKAHDAYTSGVSALESSQPSPEEDFNKNTFEKNGTLYQRNNKGGFDVLKEAPDLAKQQKQFQDDTAAWNKSVLDMAKQIKKDRETPSELDLNPAQKPLEEYMEEAENTLNKFRFYAPTAPQQTSGQSPMGGGMGLPPYQAPPKSQEQILQDMQNRQEVNQLKSEMPLPTQQQLAAPYMGAQLESLPNGAVVGPIRGSDGTENLYQWNAKAKKLVKIGPYQGSSPDRGPPERAIPEPEFSPGMW